jgi:dihydroxy-acid dehydratase
LKGAITIQDIDDIGRRVPLLVDLKPSGDNYMTDFHNAGGMPALLTVLRPLLFLDVLTITGATLRQVLDEINFRPFQYTSTIIQSLENPLYRASSLVVLRGNLCPDGAKDLVKPQARHEE